MDSIPDPSSPARVADWIELMISTEKNPLSKAYVANAIEAASGEEPSEAFITSVWRELLYRESLYSRNYFKVDETTIVPRRKTFPVEYIACLLLSLYGVPGNSNLPAKLFERLSCEAVQAYLTGRAIVFGWPFEPQGDDEETAIKQKVRLLATDAVEKFNEAPAARFKDRGLDIVGWIPFKDGRSSQSIILIQCAAGHNWADKSPVPMGPWCQYIHWACDPIKGFAVPCVIDERDWHENSRVKGVLFDRPRILNFLPSVMTDKTLKKELAAWVEDELNNLE